MPPLILASTSRYRHALLHRLGIPFDSIAPNTSEAHVVGELPADRAVRLSLEKARSVAARHPTATVIGSDQVASLATQILDKPADAAQCARDLERLSGQTARFHTGCAVLAPANSGEAAEHLIHLDTTQVTFRHLTRAEIDRYVERDRPLDCAGSFKAEALGISLFESIQSVDPTALVGLPLIWVADALRKVGYAVP